MSMRIVDEPEITLTRSEHGRLLEQYRLTFRYWSGTVPPLTFEEWLRTQGYGQRASGGDHE